jgi:hypothetical protein
MTIYVKYEDFINYQKEHHTFYLDKKNRYRLFSSSKQTLLNDFNQVNEMFDGIYTDYEFSSESTNENICVVFYTNSDTKYRFDLSKEKNTDIYHLSFTLDNRNKNNYDDLSELNESKEVFGKLSYILKDLTPKFNIIEYCIGATGNAEKDNIYQYMMQYVKKWDKRSTIVYPLGWALYFTI